MTLSLVETTGQAAIVISNFIVFVFFIFLVMSSHQCDQMSLVTDNGQAATSIAPTAQTIVWSYTRDALCEIHQLNRQSDPSLTDWLPDSNALRPKNGNVCVTHRHGQPFEHKSTCLVKNIIKVCPFMILEIWLYNIDISAQRPNQASCSWFVSTPIKSRFFNSKLCFKKSIGVGIWYIFIFVCVLHWNAQLLRFPLAGCIKSFSPLRGAPVELIYTTICKGVSNHFSKYSSEKMPDHCLPSKNLPD